MPVIVFAAVASGGAAALGAGALTLVGVTGASTLAATAVGAGLISGGVTALQGGDAGDVLKSAVVGGVTTYAGGVIGGKVASSVTAAAAPKFPELAKIMGNVAGAIAQGGTSASLTAVAYGGDPVDALIKGGLTAGLTAGAMQGVTAITGKSTEFSKIPEPAQRAVNTAIAAGALGQNPSEAAVSELLSVAGERMGNEFRDYSKQLKDSWTKTKTAADTVNANMQQQQALADEYNNYYKKHTDSVTTAQAKVDEYNASFDEYKRLEKSGASVATLNTQAEKVNALAAEANKLIEPLKASETNLASLRTKFDTTANQYQTYYDQYAKAQSDLDATTKLFADAENENLNVVKKYYEDVNDIKTTFKDELGRDATAKELASLFKTDDYNTTASDYVSQKKWEAMSPDEQYQAKLDFLQSSVADASGTVLPSSFYKIPKDVQNLEGLAARPGEVAGDIIPVLEEDGNYSYKRTISGVTQDGKEYEYTAAYDPLDKNNPVTYTVSGGVTTDLPSGSTMSPVLVEASRSRPVFDAKDSVPSGTPFSQRNIYNAALNDAVRSRLASGQARSGLTTAQTELAAAQASGNADAIAKAKVKVDNATAQAAEAEAAEKEKVGRLEEVTVEGQQEAQYRYRRAQQLMGEAPTNIISGGGGYGESDPSGLLIAGEESAPSGWKMPGLKERFLKAGLAPTTGYQSIFDPVKTTEEIISPEETPEEPSMYSPFTDTFAAPTANMAQDPFAYSMQNIPSASMTPDPLAQSAPTTPNSFYSYGNPNPLQTFTQSPFYQTPTSQIQQLARGGLAHFARGGPIDSFAALFAAAGGHSKVPHKGSHYVQGAGGGQDDLIDARLADGEYVFDADIVAALGDGSNKEGAKRLDKMREAIRTHKRGAPNDKIPPKAKSPLAYFKEAK